MKVVSDNNSTKSSNTEKRVNFSNLFEAYSVRNKTYYAVATNNFERKYILYLEECDKSDDLTDDSSRAFSIVLTGTTRQSYLDFRLPNDRPLDALARYMRDRFHTPENCRSLVYEWYLLSIFVSKLFFPDRKPIECPELLIDKMSNIQSSLPDKNRSDTIFRDTLSNAVRNDNKCQLFYNKPADIVQGVIFGLDASLTKSKREVAK